MKYSLVNISIMAIACLQGNLAIALPFIYYEYVPTIADPWRGLMTRGSAFSSRAETRAWDSWNLQTIDGFVHPHGHEIGEDMILVPGTAGRISDLGLTIINRTGQDVVGSIFARYSCYSESGLQLFSHTLDFYFDPAFPLRTGSGALVHVGAGVLYQTGDIVPERCSFSITFSSIDFPLATELEQAKGPLLLGSSDEFYHDFTTDSDIAIPGGGALAMLVATQPAPGPGSTAILLATLPWSVRRRR
jgi:hypothetical protein